MQFTITKSCLLKIDIHFWKMKKSQPKLSYHIGIGF